MAKDHIESGSFDLFGPPSHPLLLGLPWLAKHNPHINWASREILGWSKNCLLICFPSETSSVPLLSTHHLASLNTDFLDLCAVPACYMDLKEVLNKA